MRIRSKIASGLLIVAAAVGLVVGNGQVPAFAAHAAGICDVSGSPCLNEWGGTGPSVKLYQTQTGNEQWGWDEVNLCAGDHFVTSTCPFTVGSGMNNEFLGDDIVQPSFQGGVHCMGTDPNTGLAVNRNCGDLNGSGAGTGAFQVLANCAGTGTSFHCNMVNKYWSNVHGTPAFVCGASSSNGASITMDNAPSSCTGPNAWHEWF